MNIERLKKDLEKFEGKRHKLYRDQKGIMTIGVGRNLEDNPLTNFEIDFLLTNDIKKSCSIASKFFPNIFFLNEIRQEILVNMAFQLGNKIFEFKKMKKALDEKDFKKAAAEMMNSRWARQTPSRAYILSNRFLKGKI